MYTIRPFINSILYNLIGNSIKFRARGRQPIIEISSQMDGERAKISVKDNGIGMDVDKYKDEIFRMYKRFNEHTEGKGLGLYLVKLQTDAIAGEISVKSNVNEGTEFVISVENVTAVEDQVVFENDQATIFFNAFTNTSNTY